MPVQSVGVKLAVRGACQITSCSSREPNNSPPLATLSGKMCGYCDLGGFQRNNSETCIERAQVLLSRRELQYPEFCSPEGNFSILSD